MEHKKFGELSRDEKMGLLAAWIDGKVIECFLRERACDDSAWHPVHAPRWEPELCYRIASVPIVKPSINWDHVAERFIALAVSEDGFGCLFMDQPFSNVYVSSFVAGKFALADSFASYCPGSFTTDENGDVANYRDSVVFRPGHEPKGE